MTRKLFPVLLCAVLAAAAAGFLNSGSGSEPVKLATCTIQICLGIDHCCNIDRTVEALRRISAETIVRQNKLQHVLFCGDLNSKFNSPVIRQVQKCGFRIVNGLSGKMPSCPANKTAVLLDYICVYPADAARVIDCRVPDEQLASDHRPVRGRNSCFRPQRNSQNSKG